MHRPAIIPLVLPNAEEYLEGGVAAGFSLLAGNCQPRHAWATFGLVYTGIKLPHSIP